MEKRKAESLGAMMSETSSEAKAQIGVKQQYSY